MKFKYTIQTGTDKREVPLEEMRNFLLERFPNINQEYMDKKILSMEDVPIEQSWHALRFDDGIACFVERILET